MAANSSQAIKLFICYAREDEKLCQNLERHLMALKRQGLIDVWYDRQINAGTEWEREIHKHLNAAQIILLLISPDFIASDYCYDIEMIHAMERHWRGEACVIPIILRPTHWQGTPFGKLQVLPTNATPVVSSEWHDQDEAFFDIVEGIKKVIEDFFSTVSQKNSQSQGVLLLQYLTRRKVIIIGGGVLLAALAGGTWELHNVLSSPHVSSSPHLPFTYTGHTNTLETVKWSPDGMRIASGGLDTTVRIWDALTGKHEIIYQEHLKGITGVAWSPSGLQIASCSDDSTVHVWNASTKEDIFPFTKHTDVVHDVAWSPDGARIASASSDSTVQVFDATSGSSLYAYRGHTGIVVSLAWSPNSKYIASVGGDSHLHVWDATTGNTLFPPLYFPFSGLHAVAWSPNGRYISIGGNAKPASIVENNGNIVYTYFGHSAAVRRFAWSPDGKRIASASFDKTVQVWDALSGKNVFIYNRHTAIVVGLDWSRDGKYIASGSYDKTVQVWNAPTS